MENLKRVVGLSVKLFDIIAYGRYFSYLQTLLTLFQFLYMARYSTGSFKPPTKTLFLNNHDVLLPQVMF